MFRFQFIPVRPFTVFKNGIAGVQVHLRCAGNQAENHVEVSHQFFRISSSARIIAGRLDPAGERLGRIRIKSADIISLPAVQGNRNSFQFFDRGIRIHTHCRITFFRIVITHGLPPFVSSGYQKQSLRWVRQSHPSRSLALLIHSENCSLLRRLQYKAFYNSFRYCVPVH